MKPLDSCKIAARNSDMRTRSIGRPNGRGMLGVLGTAFLFACTSYTSASDTRAANSRHDQDQGKAWVGTWSASPQPAILLGASLLPPGQPDGFTNQTVRNVVRTSIGGDRVRIRLSNAYGTAPLLIGAAHVAVRGSGPSIVPTSDHALTFSGASSIAIPPGALVVSDPVTLRVQPRTDLAISIHLPGPTGAPTLHWRSLSTNFISPPGNFVATTSMPVATTEYCAGPLPIPGCSAPWFYVVGVEVLAPSQAAAIVTLGDSNTDSFQSTIDANRRWPDVLAERLLMRRDAARRPLGVLNAGISGNGIQANIVGENALARFDRDVLAQSGVEFLIVFSALNDLRSGATADRMIAAYRQIIERAHLQGIKVLGATVTPAAIVGPAEQERQLFNRYVRTGGEFDGVIDFDAAVFDPSNPNSLLPVYDSGDHVHPNDAGYRVMGYAIDLRLFDRP